MREAGSRRTAAAANTILAFIACSKTPLNSSEQSHAQSDSFTRELAEKSRVLELIRRPTALEGRALSTDQLAYNQQLTEAELERLKTEEALARMNRKMRDKVADNEREERSGNWATTGLAGTGTFKKRYGNPANVNSSTCCWRGWC